MPRALHLPKRRHPLAVAIEKKAERVHLVGDARAAIAPPLQQAFVELGAREMSRERNQVTGQVLHDGVSDLTCGGHLFPFSLICGPFPKR